VLVVALAATLVGVAALAADSAVALPEWGRCEVSPTHEGRFTNGNCTTKAKKVSEKFTGEFEWHNSTTFVGAGGGFESAREVHIPAFNNEVGPVTLNATIIMCEPSQEKLAHCREGEKQESMPFTVECPEIHDAVGFFGKKSPKEITNYFEGYWNCHALGVACSNETDFGNGLLLTKPLRGVLGYIKKAAPKEVGIDWKPESGSTFAKFSCGESLNVVLGAAAEKEGPFYPPKGAGGGMIAGPVTPINEMVKTVTMVRSASPETDETTPTNFEGKPLQELEASFYDPNVLHNGSKWGPAGETYSHQKLSLCGSCNFSENLTELKA
jgi:hypothetical protein